MYLGKSNQLNSALAVASQNTAYSNSFNVGFGVLFALQVQATSSGVVAVRIQLQQSYHKLDGSVGYVEGASSVAWVVPDLQPDVITLLGDTNFHIRGFAPTEARWARFLCTGQGSNDASTTLNLIVLTQEPGRSLAGN